jgi:hypothetical protein
MTEPFQKPENSLSLSAWVALVLAGCIAFVAFSYITKTLNDQDKEALEFSDSQEAEASLS